MTDAALAAATVAVTQIEVDARSHMEASAADAVERDAAIGVMRQAGALRRAQENWIVTRAIRAQQDAARAR